jgi:hypothetical protein
MIFFDPSQTTMLNLNKATWQVCFLTFMLSRFDRDIGNEAQGKRFLKLTNWSWLVDDLRLVSVGNWGVSNWSGVDDWSGVHNWSVCVDSWGWFWDDSLEAMNVISGVVDGSDWTIRFDQRVLSLNDSTVASFVLWLDVSCMVILNSIVEWIFWVILEILIKIRISLSTIVSLVLQS